jgi:nucleoside-diphosphate-sugar epimerase
LLFLGSSCIYPANCPQPIKEEYLLTGPLEYTNEPYAIAKITGIKMCESYYRQYGCNFISVMPTNLYGPYDNYNLETSHVLPALIRKMNLGRCLEANDWKTLREDLNKRPIEGVSGESSEQTILAMLAKYGIVYEKTGDGRRTTDIGLKKTDDGRRTTDEERRMTDIGLKKTDDGRRTTDEERRMTDIGLKKTKDGRRTTEENHRSSVISHPSSIVNPQSSVVGPQSPVIITLWGSGQVFREFLHVDDMTSACYFVMQHIDAPKLYDELKISQLNIGSGMDLTIFDLAQLVKKITGFKGTLEWNTAMPDGTFKKQLDVSRLNFLGWRFQISLEEGIREVYLNYIQ